MTERGRAGVVGGGLRLAETALFSTSKFCFRKLL